MLESPDEFVDLPTVERDETGHPISPAIPTQDASAPPPPPPPQQFSAPVEGSKSRAPMMLFLMAAILIGGAGFLYWKSQDPELKKIRQIEDAFVLTEEERRANKPSIPPAQPIAADNEPTQVIAFEAEDNEYFPNTIDAYTLEEVREEIDCDSTDHPDVPVELRTDPPEDICFTSLRGTYSSGNTVVFVILTKADNVDFLANYIGSPNFSSVTAFNHTVRQLEPHEVQWMTQGNVDFVGIQQGTRSQGVHGGTSYSYDTINLTNPVIGVFVKQFIPVEIEPVVQEPEEVLPPTPEEFTDPATDMLDPIDVFLPVERGLQGQADARDAQRRSDINTLLNATFQYMIDNNGLFPEDFPTTPTEICATKGPECGDMAILLDDFEAFYLVNIPVDPATPANHPGSNYVIHQAGGRITVSAPNAESGELSVTR